MKSQSLWALPCLALALAATGCLGYPEEELGSAEQDLITANSLTANSLTSNSLTSNSLTSNSLTSNSLTSNSLTSNGLVAGALVDPASREVLKYIVSCALPAGAHIDILLLGQSYGFDGQLGLAPGWANGECNSACRRWISACVLARINYLGQTIPLSIRGNNAALASTSAERQSYPDREATYYGNIFTTPQQRYACLSPGKTEIPRVCGPSLDGCVVDVIGSCDQTCDSVGSDGSFGKCHDYPRIAHKGYPSGTLTFNEPITVFLQ